jgi:hypothetical protein
VQNDGKYVCNKIANIRELMQLIFLTKWTSNMHYSTVIYGVSISCLRTTFHVIDFSQERLNLLASKTGPFLRD